MHGKLISWCSWRSLCQENYMQDFIYMRVLCHSITAHWIFNKLTVMIVAWFKTLTTPKQCKVNSGNVCAWSLKRDQTLLTTNNILLFLRFTTIILLNPQVAELTEPGCNLVWSVSRLLAQTRQRGEAGERDRFSLARLAPLAGLGEETADTSD